jgi:hypothetical protein
MQKMIIGILLLLSIVMVGCAKEQVIGGDKDKMGCLVSAGYTWNATITACVRPWELDESQAKAAQIAVAPMSIMPRTIVKVETLRCEGCFIVSILRGDTQEVSNVTLVNWKFVFKNNINKIENFEECISAGNPVMESYPRQCSFNGSTFTESLKHVCTNIESLQTACTMEYNPVCGEYLLNSGKTMYQTFGNGCSACAAMKVVSYTQGECPSNMTGLITE